MSIIDTAEAAVSPYTLAAKIVGGLLILAAVFGAGFYTESRFADSKIEALQLADSKEQTANISASLTQLQSFIGSMDAAGNDYTTQLAAIKSQFATIQQELSHATHTPLPADCKPTADRLHVLADAVSAANHGPSAAK